uniref:FAD dependent oxidoreductase domain-containing protein n=1 Tax=Clastoptera arizonana TaxID=38151 RepID=A0A1B6DIR6_9HEMI
MSARNSVLRVGVLGAGVVGVTSALELQDEFPTAYITIVADKFYQDTTSDGAAGFFRPGIEFSGPNENTTKKWIDDSYYYYKRLMDSESACGVSVLDGYFFSDKNIADVRNPLLENLLPIVRSATPEELQIGKKIWKYGVYCESLLIECPKFLPWALTKFKAQGGHVRRQTIDRLGQLEGEFDVVVNCCGLQARYLCNDTKVMPVRGQILKVNAPWLKKFYYEGSDTYIIPNKSGSVTLGGCRQLGSNNLEVCPFDSASIQQRCYNVLPKLKQAPILREWVGLRPYRPIIRVEPEQLNNLKIVHNYGHGGYGVTSAPGTSKHAVQIVRQSLKCNSKL